MFSSRWFSLLTLITVSSYLVTRLFVGSEDAAFFSFWVLWSAELFGLMGLALFVLNTWHKSPTKRTSDFVLGKVATLIPTFDEDKTVVLPTILGAIEIVDNDQVWVLDDGNRDWLKSICEELDVNYLARTSRDHAKAGNINNALSQIDAEFVFIVDADHVPNYLAVRTLKRYFVDQSVGIVQSPHGFRNLDSVQHYTENRHDQSLFFDVLMPHREALNAAFWCGSGAMIRMRALHEIGGISTKTITEDIETSVKMERAGYKTVYHNQQLITGIAPTNWQSYLIQRYRWARGTIELLTSRESPITAKGYKFSTRLAYLSNLIHHLVPFQVMAFVLVLVLALLFGLLPIAEPPIWLIVFWGVQISMSMVLFRARSEKSMRLWENTQNAWLNGSIFPLAWFMALIGSKAKFKVTPKTGNNAGGFNALRLMWVPVVAAALLSVAVILRGLDFIFDLGLPELVTWAVLPIFAFALLELYLLSRLLWRLFWKRQHRYQWREEVFRPVRLGGTIGILLNLSVNGALVHLPDPAPEIDLNDLLPLKISSGKNDINSQMCIRHITKTKEGFELGGSIQWHTQTDEYRAFRFLHGIKERT